MSDLSHKHILAFVVLFLALFAILFAGVIQVHRNTQRHATAQYAPAAKPAPTN